MCALSFVDILIDVFDYDWYHAFGTGGFLYESFVMDIIASNV